jgi:peroxiredoxin
MPGIPPGPIPAVTLAPGDQAPNFRLKPLDGNAVELAGLRGTPVVLHFWTTWCIACAADMPGLAQLADDLGNDVHVLGINVGESASRAEMAASTAGAAYPILRDADEEVAHHYGFWDYPATVVIDANGRIVAIHDGQVSADQIRADLTQGNS